VQILQREEFKHGCAYRAFIEIYSVVNRAIAGDAEQETVRVEAVASLGDVQFGEKSGIGYIAEQPPER
jgi:hypothetical protein